jgi:transcriptional regulator GlxA family with amidase domain
VLYVDDGDVLTSAGVAAGLDLCLHIVRLDLGPEIANALARRLVVSPHRPGGQAQYVETPLPKAEDDSLAPLLQWAVAHLQQPLTIADLARRQHVTPRTLVRRFHAATGMPPLQWLLTQRVQRACALLESTSKTPSTIAELCGLGSEANLRHHFARIVGLPPSGYRQTFPQQGPRASGRPLSVGQHPVAAPCVGATQEPSARRVNVMIQLVVHAWPSSVNACSQRARSAPTLVHR